METIADRINEICQYILNRNSDICGRVSPNSDDEGQLLEEEMQTVIEHWQRFAESDDLKLYYGERFMVMPPKNGEKRLMKVFNAKSVCGEHPFETMTSMRSVDGTIQGNIRIWEE